MTMTANRRRLAVALTATALVLPACLGETNTGAVASDTAAADTGGVDDAVPSDTVEPLDTEAAPDVDTSELDGTDTSDLDADGDVVDVEPDAADGLDAALDTDSGAADSEAQDTVDADTTNPVVFDPTIAGYPDAELLVRIIAPGAHGTAAVTEPVITLEGVLFGDADELVWELGTQSGSPTVRTFWESGPITLQPGDNAITVTAREGEERVTDTVVVTYADGVRLVDSPPSPSAAWVGESTPVTFALRTTPSYTALGAMVLYRSDAGGGLGEIVAEEALLPTGPVERVLREVVTCEQAGPLYFRAGLAVTATSPEVYSPVMRVDCVERLTSASCDAHRLTIDAAAQALSDGYDVFTVIGDLGDDPTVAQAGIASGDGQSVWIRFGDGVLGAVLVGAPGTRGAPGAPPATAPFLAGTPRLGDRGAVVLAPFLAELGATDDAPGAVDAIGQAPCAVYDVTGPVADEQASLSAFRALPGHGVISISTHGEVLFEGLADDVARDRYGWHHVGGQEVLWTGEPVSCPEIQYERTTCMVQSDGDVIEPCAPGERCSVSGSFSGGGVWVGVCVDDTALDLAAGRVVMTNRGYAVTPAFFAAHRGDGYPASLVNLGACRTMYDGTLASELFASGARAITGFSGVVDSGWARDRVLELLAGFGSGAGVTAGYVPAEDPAHPGTWWRFFGAPHLDASGRGLLNGDFERPNLAGWDREGRASVVSHVGMAAPHGGDAMALLEVGSIWGNGDGHLSQRMCLPAETLELEMYWAIGRDNPLADCGESLTGRFVAELAGHAGTVTLVDVRIDDLCPRDYPGCSACEPQPPCDLACMGEGGCYAETSDGASCSGEYLCQCGRYASWEWEIVFDGARPRFSPWLHTVKDVASLAGTGPVTLRAYFTGPNSSINGLEAVIDDVELH